MLKEKSADDVIGLFNKTFAHLNTVLVRGTDEPVYLPKDEKHPQHRIVFAHGFFSSALHEIAHWCIAGEKRRQLVDYGYWYAPDGRDEAQQKAFEQVEVKPQAIEWAFSLAAAHRFRVSTDNLNGAQPDTQGFTRAVRAQLADYIENGFPPRAQQFIDALCRNYATAPVALPCPVEEVA